MLVSFSVYVKYSDTPIINYSFIKSNLHSCGCQVQNHSICMFQLHDIKLRLSGSFSGKPECRIQSTLETSFLTSEKAPFRSGNNKNQLVCTFLYPISQKIPFFRPKISQGLLRRKIRLLYVDVFQNLAFLSCLQGLRWWYYLRKINYAREWDRRFFVD